MRRVSLSIFSCDIGIGTLYNLDPTLALKLRQELSFPTTRIGSFFLLIFFGQILVSTISMLIPEKWDKRPILLTSYFVLFVAPLMVGPSQFLHFPNSPTLIGGGLFLLGMGQAPLSTYTVTEAIEGGTIKFPDERT